MANAMTITYGSTTLNLLDITNYGVESYVPLPGEGEGEGFVTETARVWVKGSSRANLETALRALQTALWKATRYHELGQGDAVYVNLQPNGSAASWRSQIVGGAVVSGAETLGVDVANLEMLCEVTWVRRGYWEGAEARLPVTNVNGTDAELVYVDTLDTRTGTSPTIKCNYVEVDGVNDVAGNLPGFIRLYQEIYDSAAGYDCPVFERLFIGQAIYADFTKLDTTIAYTAGGYTCSWSATTETEIRNGDTVVEDIDGWYKVMLVLTSACALTDLYLRFDLTVTLGGVAHVVYGSDYVLYDGKLIVDLGMVRLPPYMGTGNQQATIRIYAKSATTGTKTLVLTYIELKPMDGYREVETVGDILYAKHTTGAHTAFVLDETVDDGNYLEGSTVKSCVLQVTGKRLAVFPGEVQRFYFSYLVPAGVTIDHTFVTIYYRPRRLTL